MTAPTPYPLELRLMLQLCREGSGGEDAQDPAALDDAGLRRRFLELATLNGVAGLALASLARRGSLERLAPEAARDFATVLATLRRRVAFDVLERDRVLAFLSEADVRPVVLKGAGLATTFYREPVERPFGDLDLLVAEDEFEPTVRALAGLGYESPWSDAEADLYRKHHFHLRLLHRGGFILEVHWGLTRSTRGFRLEPESFRAGATSRSGFRMPCPEHLVLHAVAQTAGDALPRLSQFLDVDRVVRRSDAMDWDRTIREARASGLANTLAYVSETCGRLLGTPVPAAVRERLWVPPITRWHLRLHPLEEALLARRKGRRWRAAHLLSFWQRDGLRPRWEFVRDRLRESPLAGVRRGMAEPPARDGSGSGRFGGLVNVLALQAQLYRRRLTCRT